MQPTDLRTIPKEIQAHPHWLDWFLMYAEYGDRRLALADATIMPYSADSHALGFHGRYLVGVGPEECEVPDSCTAPSRRGHAKIYYAGDNLDDAVNMFRRLEQQLFLILALDA